MFLLVSLLPSHMCNGTAVYNQVHIKSQVFVVYLNRNSKDKKTDKQKKKWQIKDEKTAESW